jgi:hypothetical protein
LLAAGLVSGCDGPFALRVTHVNENGPQRNAVIAISDPQIYTRERLLNDRDAEIAFLLKELEAINTKDFTPRLKRDLDEIVEIVGALSVKFNPVAAANIEQASEISGLKNEIEVERLKNLLKEVKAANTPADKAAASDTANAATTNSDTLAAQALTDATTQLSTIITALEKRITDASGNTLGRPTLRPNTVSSATPSEEFRDKMAYRNEIVSALEQAQLDDRHDLNGNALYRLQFKATVFPGEVKNKYGVARLTILPPLFEDNRAVSKLYLDWLAYVGSQLNPAPGTAPVPGTSQPTAKDEKEGAEKAAAAVSALSPDAQTAERYRLLGPAAGIYSTLSIPYGKEVALDLTDANNDPTTLAALKSLAAGAADPDSPAGKLVVPIPQGFQSATLIAALVNVKSQRLAAFLNHTRESLEHRYPQTWSRGAPYLRWAKADSGRCMSLTEAKSSAVPATTAVATGANGAATTAATTAGAAATAPVPVATPTSYDMGDYVADEKKTANALMAIADDTTGAEVDNLALAITLARNIHNLAPTYLLAFERSLNRVKSKNGAPAEQLNNYAASLSGLVTASDLLLQSLYETLQTPIRAQVIAGTGSPPDIYGILESSKSTEELQQAVDAVTTSDDPDLVARKKLVGEIAAKIPCMSLDDIATRIYVPEAFYSTVTGSRNDHFMTGGHRPYAGDSYAYSTAPSELAQRISTVASATQALDLIASVSAIIPSVGTGLSGAGEYRKVATGHVDAIESAPLIVGFSNSGAANKERGQYGGQNAEPSFGWVFGPKVIVDAEHSELDLSQVLVEQPVTADVSVPGWWTKLRLRVETIWAANFDKGVLSVSSNNNEEQPKSRVSDYVMDVPLQTNPATYEQLTEFIANKAWGLQYRQPVILSVAPKALPACKDVTLLVSGPDLWRGRQVYLDGMPAKSTTIMPDMRGLAVTFDLSKATPKNDAVLTIWTQLGQASGSVAIVAGDSCKAKKYAISTVTLDNLVLTATGSSLALTADAPWPDAAKLTVRVFPKGQPTSQTALVNEGSVFVSGNKLNVTLKNWTGAKPANTTEFEGVVLLSDGVQTLPLAQFGPLYFYADIAAASVTFAPNPAELAAASIPAAGLNLPVNVTFPPGFALQHPADMKDGFKLIARTATEPKLAEFGISAEDTKQTVVQGVLKLDQAKMNELAAQADALLDLVLVNAVTLEPISNQTKGQFKVKK